MRQKMFARQNTAALFKSFPAGRVFRPAGKRDRAADVFSAAIAAAGVS